MTQYPGYIQTPLAPPAHIAYAHKQGRGLLTFRQVQELVKPINPAYVEVKQSKSYLAQHQARAEMNRIFGYGNWDSQVLQMEQIYETSEERANGKTYWIVAYKALVQVNVRDLWGMPVATFSEWHAEENAAQPNRGEAHALAMTSVESYALRRALIGLGDRLGLGLYSKGSTAAHGQYTIQEEPGQLFTWTPDPNPVPTAQSTPEAQAAPAAEAAAEAPSDPAPAAEPAPSGTTPNELVGPEMQNFRAAQERIQSARMTERLQAGLKVDDPAPGGEQQ